VSGGRRFLAIALVAFLSAENTAAQQAPGDSWRFVDRNKHGATFVDPATLQRDGGTFTIVQRLVPTRPRNGSPTLLMLVRHDCVRRTNTPLAEIQLGAAGSRISERVHPAPRARNSNPRTPAATILDMFCGR
jgi:hypothetical protein